MFVVSQLLLNIGDFPCSFAHLEVSTFLASLILLVGLPWWLRW